MSPSLIYVSGIAASVGVSSTLVLFLRPSLQRILIDLCGTRDRASFWNTFSSITLVLVPVTFAMFSRPPVADTPVVFGITAPLRCGMLALAATLGAIGLTIRRFIPEIKL